MKQWWDKFFHGAGYPRPIIKCDDALDAMYLARKKFLFEQFGEFSIGEEHPVMDGRYVSLVLKYGMDLIPYLFGAKLTCQEAGGFMPEEFTYEQLIKMEPVDLENHPLRRWILDEKERKLARYGVTSCFLDYESPTNIAVRLRGVEFYSDMIEDPDFARHVLSISLESIKNVVNFARANFPLSEYDIIYDYFIGNCNVIMISPNMYTEIVRPFDIALANYCYDLSDNTNLMLHHCDVNADSFLDAYAKIPGVKRFQASHLTDTSAYAAGMPGVDFYAMLSPNELNKLEIETLTQIFDRAISQGARELDLWNIDVLTPPEKLRAIFNGITNICKTRSVNVRFDVLPFVWDEIEWAYPVYQ